MAHHQQRKFFTKLRKRFPEKFRYVRVLDCGSLDVNGSLKELFTESEYIGVDIRPGKNVDLVSPVHQLPLEDGAFDTVVSAEMLEHDEHWQASLRRMVALLKPGGLLAISAAGEGRPVHGTDAIPDVDQATYGTSPSYYRNLTPADLHAAFDDAMDEHFRVWDIGRHLEHCDLYFFGVTR
jgi:SAM-dependent methyltransferase